MQFKESIAIKYFSVYEKRKIIQEYYKIILIGTLIVYLVFILFKDILTYNHPVLNIKYYITILVPIVYFFTIIFFKIFHRYYGEMLEYTYYNFESEKVVTTYLSGSVHFTGQRGSGKDTTGTWLVNAFSKHYKKKMINQMEESKDFLFNFNLKKLEKILFENVQMFYPTDKKRKIENFKKFIIVNEKTILKKDSCFLMTEFIEDYDLFCLDNEKSRKNYYYNNSLIKKHYFEYLFDYSYYFYRLYIVKVLVVSNQPVLDDQFNTSFIYSEHFKHLKNSDDSVSNYDDKNDQSKYKKIKKFAFEEYMISYQTEQDIFKGNYNKKVAIAVKTSGEKEADAVRRHFVGDNFIEIKNGQVQGREHKIVREMNDWNVRVLKKINTYYPKNPLLSYYRFKYKVYTFVSLFLKSNNFGKRKLRLREKIDKQKYDSFLKIQLSFTPQGCERSVETTRVDLLDSSEQLFSDGFKVELIMSMRNTWGKYNTRYMEAVAEEQKIESEVSIATLPKFNKSLKMNKEDVIHMDNEIMDSMANIKFKDTIGTRYKKIEKKEKQKTIKQNDLSEFKKIK